MREQDIPVLEAYARALARAADQSGEIDRTFDEAGGLGAVLRQQPGLVRLMERPAVAKEEKKNLLQRVFGGRVSPLMLHLAELLVDKNRGGLWGAILERFISLVELRRGIYAAEVSTAIVLSDAERNRLQGSLERFTGKKLRIEFHDIPELLGGVLFRYGDVMIDDSILGALADLRGRLNAAKVD